MDKERKPLGLSARLGYGMGDIYGGGATTIINMYYLYFLIDIAGLPPAWAGTAFLISKLWDAVTDPVMGLISDNTRTSFGRRRPYFLAGIPLVFLSFAALWIRPGFSGQGAAFVYYLAAYVLFSTVYTMVWVPYNSIAAELTQDYDERTRLSFYRMVFSNLSGIVAAIAPKDLFEGAIFRGDPPRAWLWVGIAFGLVFALPYVGTFLACRENPEYMSLPRKRLGSVTSFVTENFLVPFENRPFRYVMLMYFFGFMAQDAVLGLAVYFLTYALGIPSMMTLLVPVYGGLLVSLVFADALARRIGKRETFLVSGGLWIVALALVLFMRPGMSVAVLYAFGLAFGVGLAGVQSMVFAIFPDVPDVDELISGARREGLYSGIFALFRKAGGAFILFLVGVLIEAAGYRAPVGGAPQAQTPGFVRSLTAIFTGLPALCVGLALFAAWRYPLSRERLDRVRRINAALRRGEALSPEDQAARSELLPLMAGSASRKDGSRA